jgi:alkylation response protein AidB-like acyl-CoA dehydrogenase
MWSQFADLGWLGIMVPEEHGGLGWSVVDVAVILGECGKALIAEPFLECGVVAATMLAGSESARAGTTLEEIVAGTSLVVPALLERGNRYRYGAPVTTASADGNGYRIAGKKILVVGGDGADLFIVTALLDAEVVLFLVGAEQEGVSRKSYRQLDGSWAADVTFDDVRVDADALIGGKDALERGLDAGAIGVAAQQVGSLDRVLELTSEYLHTRKQFGQPLAAFQALQHIMSDLFVTTEMARSAMHGGLAATSRASRERSGAVSAARARCDRAGQTVGNLGIYLHGGMGMTMEYPVGHHYRRLVQLMRAYGDTEYHLARYEDTAFEAN